MTVVTSLVGIPIGLVSSRVGLKISAGIKTYESMIKKQRKKYDIIVLFTKTKLNNTKVLISKSLIDLDVVLMNLFQ